MACICLYRDGPISCACVLCAVISGGGAVMFLYLALFWITRSLLYY